MKTVFFLSFLFLLNAFAEIPKKDFVANHTAIEFLAVGKPSMLKIKGHGEAEATKFEVSKNHVYGEVHFKLEKLDSGIELRDKHMKEKYLQVGQYPEAVLKLQSVDVPSTWTLQNPQIQSSAFKGILTLHGQSKPVTGTFAVNSKFQTDANFEIKLSDFAIDIPNYLGVKVADVVSIHVSLDLKDI